MLPIIIDYTPAATQSAGIGRLVRDQVSTLLEYDTTTMYRLFYPSKSRYPPSLTQPNVTKVTTPFSTTWQHRLWYRLHLPLPVEWLTGKFSLYHATDFLLPHTASSAPTIVTIHDLSFLRVPDAAAPSLQRFLEKAVPQSIRRATHIIADSEATRQDIIDLYDQSPEKISVVLSSVDPRFTPTHNNSIRTKYAIGANPYLLCVGTVQPRKNYSRIITALHSLGKQWHHYNLVIAGGQGWLNDEMYATIEALKMHDRVRLIGFVDDIDLPALYSAAECTIAASLYEGFGFPVLESMACGTPVITSNISSLPEVAGNAALLVDPYNVEEIAEAIRVLLSDSAVQIALQHAGLLHSKAFSPASTAQQLATVYQHVIHASL